MKQKILIKSRKGSDIQSECSMEGTSFVEIPLPGEKLFLREGTIMFLVAARTFEIVEESGEIKWVVVLWGDFIVQAHPTKTHL